MFFGFGSRYYLTISLYGLWVLVQVQTLSELFFLMPTFFLTFSFIAVRGIVVSKKLKLVFECLKLRS